MGILIPKATINFDSQDVPDLGVIKLSTQISTESEFAHVFIWDHLSNKSIDSDQNKRRDQVPNSAMFETLFYSELGVTVTFGSQEIQV